MAGSIDYTKLLSKLDPKAGGEDVLRLRTGVIDAVNSDGTVDLNISGVVVPDVPVLNGSVVSDEGAVQVLSYRGSLLVLGMVAANLDWDAGRMVAAVQLATDGTAGSSGVETAILTINAPVVAGFSYRLWAEIYVTTSASPGATGEIKLREGATTAGALIREVPADFVFGAGTNGTHFLVSGRYTASATGTQSLTVTARSSGQTVRREGGAGRVNEMWVQRSL